MKLMHVVFSLFVFFYFPLKGYSNENIKRTDDSLYVTQYNIKNDGSLIGNELNDLVKKKYGKTLYFPAGVYNLSEPIILPYNYTKNVNLVFDKNAIVKTDKPLEALLKIGYIEMSSPHGMHPRFSYIEGGMFDCSNVDNGIMINGLKQLVSLRSISLYDGKKTHIRIQVTNDFRGTGSCDTKIDNVTIVGYSSNDDITGVYIGNACGDVKMSNTFIRGTRHGIVAKSAGLILNNIHILSTVHSPEDWVKDDFRSTEGIRIETDGFFVFDEVYFDTIDKGIFIKKDKIPTLILDKNIFYSYIKDFGHSLIYKERGDTRPFQVKMANSIIEVAKQGYKIFDIDPVLIGNDIEGNFSFVNCVVRGAGLLNSLDLSLMQRVKGKFSDVVFVNDKCRADDKWHSLGALVTSNNRSVLRIDLSNKYALELSILFEKGTKPVINSKIIGGYSPSSFQIGYVIKDEYCILFIKPGKGIVCPVVVTDLLENGSFMPAPSKTRSYSFEDYSINQEPVLIYENKKH